VEDVLLIRAICGDDNLASLAVVVTADEQFGNLELVEDKLRIHEILGQVYKSGAR
jgi:hypothetical protein